MKNGRFVRTLGVASFSLVTACFCLAQTANHRTPAEATLTKPETVGFSSERLENLHKLIQGEID